jgi:hypothetical protein
MTFPVTNIPCEKPGIGKRIKKDKMSVTLLNLLKFDI